MSTTRFPTPDAAERAFYSAFSTADLEAMMEVWANSERIECIHPMAGLVRGRAAVTASWEQIFANDIEITLALTTIEQIQDATLAVHIVHEHLGVSGRSEQYPPVIATNVYRLINNNWRMVLHHASPASAEEHENRPDEAEITGVIPRLH